MAKCCEALQEEVYFWRQLLEDNQERQTLPEYRRAAEALALAEFKLEKRLQELAQQGKPVH